MAANLYGPPGTGEALCAEVTASPLPQEPLAVDYAVLVSRYVGGTTKHMTSVFRAAEPVRAGPVSTTVPNRGRRAGP